ncbi:MAG: T9SS type A sorting domain-containing protein [Crocinitomicaceae bacterium]|nr:T9SS type A sorting domain-containing protein [Crocinitomicaceae bacterium]MBP6033424.1 T9SS type A sorting domain-containing protein [Crocinitomicaceae bacterium]
MNSISFYGQVTIFSENMGSPGGTTPITSNVFQNASTLTFSSGSQANPADVRSTTPSSGYSSSSAGGNIWFTTTSGAYGFSIESIDASMYNSLSLQFGYYKNSASLHATFSVEFWNGSAWVVIANSSAGLFNEASNASINWYLSKSLSLPIGAQINGLKIRFVKTGANAIRIDDVKLIGTCSPPPTPTSSNSTQCGSGTPTCSVAGTGNGGNTFKWYTAPTGGTAISGQSGSSLTNYSINTTTNFYAAEFNGTCESATRATVTANVISSYTWTGTTSTDPSDATNWNPASVPCLGANEIIPSGLTNYPEYSNLTIASGTTMTVQSGARLSVTGVLTNNGTLTIESGATFLQGTSLAGSGTYNVKQFVTGAGGATPTGRFWYMGVPVNNLDRVTAFGTASGSNRLWSWSESGQAWSSQLVDATALTPTTGYSFRSGSDVTLNFSGTSLYSADPSISGLTNTTGSFSGCHLMSNPFTAYADWEQIYTASTNISSTYCVRSFNTANSQMVYDTYNATGDVAVSNSTIAVTRYIAPMQSFWIIVDPSTTGTFNMTKSMLSHQPTATGLKDLSTFNAFARLNLIGGNLSDQVVVYMTPDATNAMDEFDSKKMMLSNVPQVYTTVGDKKLVINGLKESKAHTIVPLTLELPTSQSYHFEMAESNVNYGLVILEDREELVFQDMTANPDYTFFAQAGISSDRFVLHFHFPLNTASTDEIGSSAQIDIVSNNTGAVNVHLSDDLQVGGEITVLDQSGRLVAKKTITQAQTLVQINETAGVYFVRVQTPGKTEMKKVVLY